MNAPVRDSSALADAFRRRVARTMSPCASCGAQPKSFCGALSDAELEKLAQIVTSLTFAPKQTVLQEGDRADFLFNVTSGTLKVFRTLPDGRTQITGFLTTGDFLGMPSGGRYTVSAEAVTRVEVCHFARNRFEALLQECPGLERRLFDMASNEIAAAQEQMLLLGRKTARERVASFLLAMARQDGCAADPAAVLTLPMSRAEIADYLGMTTETVSRTLSALGRDGTIEMRPTGQIRLPDPLRLAAVAGRG